MIIWAVVRSTRTRTEFVADHFYMSDKIAEDAAKRLNATFPRRSAREAEYKAIPINVDEAL